MCLLHVYVTVHCFWMPTCFFLMGYLIVIKVSESYATTTTLYVHYMLFEFFFGLKIFKPV